MITKLTLTFYATLDTVGNVPRTDELRSAVECHMCDWEDGRFPFEAEMVREGLAKVLIEAAKNMGGGFKCLSAHVHGDLGAPVKIEMI